MAITNTGIVERVITGVNESDLFLDSEATSVVNNTGIVERSVVGVNTSETPFWRPTESDSVVNNTGIVERPISGVNESDPMFPNNTISNIINLAGNLLIALFEAFKTRVSTDGGTLDNEVGLDTDNFDDTSSLTMLPNAYKDGTLYSVLPEDGTGDFDVVRGSGATRIDSLGNISEVSNNIPRIEYTSGSPVLLVEPQATNLAPFSEDFTSWSDSGNPVLSNNQPSPDGDNNAYLFENSSNGDRLQQSLGILSAGTYTQSMFVKYNDGDVRMNFKNNSFGGDNVFLITSSGVTAETPDANRHVENYGNGWFRISIIYTANGTNGSFVQLFGDLDTPKNGFYIFGAQLEEQPHATSYVPTTGVIATRLADSVTGAGDASTFNSTEGVLYFEGSALSNGGSNRIISLSDGTNDNLVYIRIDSTASRFRCFARGGAGSYTSALKSGISQTDNNKIAVSWDNTNLKMYINGSLAASSSINNLPVGLDRVSFTSPTGGDTFEGKVKDLRTYNTALTDAELLTLTTI
jgi:hypothetical protein|tara:strand:+ start:158 stop:1720 length:1563 start_codon:yes stop_codon:yes gene_type:complete